MGTAVGTAALVVVLVVLAWRSMDVLEMTFSGVLLATFLRATMDLLTRHTRLPSGWALAVVVTLLLALLGIAGGLWVPSLLEQLEAFRQRLPATIDRLAESLSRTPWGQALLAAVGGDGEKGLVAPEELGRLALTAPLGTAAYLMTVTFVGLFLAANPSLYVGGVLRLIPVSSRPRGRELLARLAHTLRWFLIGRAIAMTFVGVLTALALHLFGVPQPLLLGILAGLLTFAPYLGPILGGIPIVLVTLVQLPGKLLPVLLVYTVVQLIEGYILSPLIQQRTVSLPPALTLLAQVAMGLLVGATGVALAAPLAAVLMVVVQMLYVEDVLEDRGEA